MCIRDRVEVDDLVDGAERVLEATQLGHAHVHGHLPTLEGLGHLVAGLGALGATTGRLTPVSYTHLDVYKRQK